ncbi:DUF998 domain-containing protein [Candidatus Woesearchaeota archaeon]|jgi:hypothetical protein|nr:DUF998 domain-containing protein [Candidatus Woesearchaeota archaeon]
MIGSNKNFVHVLFVEYLVLFSIIFIPVYTLLFGLKKSPFEYTLSMIGNWYGFQKSFIIWGVITAVLLFFVIIHIFRRTKFQNKKAYRFLYFSAIFLILTVFVPTIHDEPIPKELRSLDFNIHAVLGVLFAVFLIVSLLLFSKYLSLVDKELSVKSFRLILFCVGGSVFTLTVFGMTGIFELFFFISLSVFLLIINKDLKSHRKV